VKLFGIRFYVKANLDVVGCGAMCFLWFAHWELSVIRTLEFGLHLSLSLSSLSFWVI
jgi:hypothetical protein